MLPQVVVLIFGGPIANRFIEKVGLDAAAWISAVSVVAGIAIYSLLGSYGYVWIAIALALEAIGIRVNGVVAGTNVMRGLPQNRTSIGAALVDTSSEVATAIGIAVAGTVLAAQFAGSITTPDWSATQTAEFQGGLQLAGLILTAVAAALVVFGLLRTRTSRNGAVVPA